MQEFTQTAYVRATCNALQQLLFVKCWWQSSMSAALKMLLRQVSPTELPRAACSWSDLYWLHFAPLTTCCCMYSLSCTGQARVMTHLRIFEQVNKCLKEGNADYAEEAHLQEQMTAEFMCSLLAW